MHLGFRLISSSTSLTSDSVLDLLKPLPSEIPGGEIIRDPGLGVFCDTAATLVENISPNKTEEELTTMFKTAIRDLNSVGLVGVHDAGVTPRNIKLYQKYILSNIPLTADLSTKESYHSEFMPW